LIAALSEGCATSSEIYAEFGARLARIVAARVMTSEVNIEDACGIAWMKLVRCRPRTATVRAWLVTVACREAVRLDRASRRIAPLASGEPEAGEVAEPAAPDDPFDRALAVTEALEAVANLPERRRRMAMLHALGFSYREIAELTGHSPRTVDKQLRRARKVVRHPRRRG